MHVAITILRPQLTLVLILKCLLAILSALRPVPSRMSLVNVGRRALAGEESGRMLNSQS